MINKRCSALSRASVIGLLGVTLSGCIDARQQRLATGEVPTLIGPPVRDTFTPMGPVLTCLGKAASIKTRPIVIAVGDVRDVTGKYSVNEGNAITQGGALMVASALGKIGPAIRIAERFDPTIAERELGYADRRQLGDGQVHDVPGTGGPSKVPWLPYFGGSIAASDFYIVGGITELNYGIRSGGLEAGIGQIGPKARSYAQSVAIDLRIVDTRSLLVVGTISLTKQFVGYEVGFNVFRFFGSRLFDVNIGFKGQEPLQLGIRLAIEEGVARLFATVARLDPAQCFREAAWPGIGTGNPVIAYSPVPARDVGGRRPDFPASSVPTGSERLNPSITVKFDFGSSVLSSATHAALNAAIAPENRGDIVLVGPDSETLDPAKRDMLIDQRIAAIRAALAIHGIAADRLRTIWRPAANETGIRRADAGLLILARLRLQR